MGFGDFLSGVADVAGDVLGYLTAREETKAAREEAKAAAVLRRAPRAPAMLPATTPLATTNLLGGARDFVERRLAGQVAPIAPSGPLLGENAIGTALQRVLGVNQPMVEPTTLPTTGGGGIRMMGMARRRGLGLGPLVSIPGAMVPHDATVTMARRVTAVGPDGSLNLYQNMGRPILFSGDLAACRRVDRVARRVGKVTRRRR